MLVFPGTLGSIIVYLIAHRSFMFPFGVCLSGPPRFVEQSDSTSSQPVEQYFQTTLLLLWSCACVPPKPYDNARLMDLNLGGLNDHKQLQNRKRYVYNPSPSLMNARADFINLGLLFQPLIVYVMQIRTRLKLTQTQF